jgi:hypothetical protein
MNAAILPISMTSVDGDNVSVNGLETGVALIGVSRPFPHDVALTLAASTIAINRTTPPQTRQCMSSG